MKTETYTSSRQWFAKIMESEDAHRAPLKLLLFLLRILSFFYGFLVRIRSLFYRVGVFRTMKLPRRVISVGNITVGGTGKTPMVLELASHFQKRGNQVAVLSRGYGREGDGATYRLVSDGQRILESPERAGDEAYFIARELPGIIVAVAKDRFRAGLRLLEKYKIDLFILDDGYQHLRLYRDLNILLLKSDRPFGNGFLLPRGTLREPPSGMNRANLILVTGKKSGIEIPSGPVQPKYPEGIPVCRVFFRGASFRNMTSGEEVKAETLSGKKCLLVSGIADPASFKKLVESQGIAVERELVFPDHHKYLPDDLDAVENIARYRKVDVVITTDKDAVKWKSFNGNDVPVLVLKLSLSPIDPLPWSLIEGKEPVPAT